jgi:hypothetical protein
MRLESAATPDLGRIGGKQPVGLELKMASLAIRLEVAGEGTLDVPQARCRG